MPPFKRTVAQLRADGYRVQPAPGCKTAIIGSRPFWTLDPSHAALTSNPEAVLDVLQPASAENDKFVAYVAGAYDDADVPVPSIVVDQNQLGILQMLQARLESAREMSRLACQQYLRAHDDLRGLLSL